MSRQGDSLKFLNKTQACVMRVNICCDGCQRKLKKVLLKTDGVYAVSINVEERMVTVTGSVEPDVLIKKLNKAGKHAELLSVKGSGSGGGGAGGGGKGQSLTDQLQKLQLEHQMQENGKAQKEGGGVGGGKGQSLTGQLQKLQLEHQMQKNGKAQKEGGGVGGGKGQSLTGQLQNLQLEHQMQKNGKAQKEGGGGGGGGGRKEQKGQPVAETQQEGKGLKDIKFPSFKDLKLLFKKDNSKAAAKLKNPSPKEELDDGSDFDDEFDDFDDDDELHDLDEYSDDELMMKPNGSGVTKDKGGEKGINGDGKNGGGGNNNNNKGGNGNGNSNSNAGSHAHNGRPSSNKGGGSNNGEGGGLPMGQPHMMGQFGNMHPPMGLMGNNNAQGLPAGAYFPPETMAGDANPYQQQYLQALMQQRLMMNGLDRPAFQPMGYGYGPQPVYIPQPHPYTMFSDENPTGCSIM